MKPLGRRHVKNPQVEAEQFRRRAALGVIGIAVALLGLALGYFRLQVLQHDEYRTRSEQNRIKLRPIVPARGLIYDRNGELLADNVSAYRLELVPEQVGNVKETLAALGELIALTPEDLRRFENTRRVSRRFLPVTLKLRLSEQEVARLAVNRHRFPGVDVVPYLTRRYLHGDLFAHVIGYVSRLDEQDLKELGDERYSALTHIGKSGIERAYEQRLRGSIGYEEVETNVQGRSLRVLRRHDALPGEDLRLSIDANVQRAIVAAFGEQNGSAVAVDPNTGEVLALVSLPSFDANLFVNGISHTDYNALTGDISRPLFNRVVQGGTPPGSTLKPFVGLAGLESGVRKTGDKTLSTGEFRLPGVSRGFRDSHAGGHGWVDLRESIAQSVNTYYYKLALDMGIDKFDSYLQRYGFGRPTGIDLATEGSGVLPSPAWKRKRFNQPWYAGDTVNAAIGQGLWLVTPLQLAQGTATLADGGIRRPLRLVHASRKGFLATWQTLPLPASESIGASVANLGEVKAGMVAVVHGPTGTARAIGIGAPYLIAGKTGTAQRISRKGSISHDPRSLPLSQRHQALFIAYAPADAPKIAVAVVVEHGGFGATAAAPIARKAMDAYLVKPDAPPAGNPAAVVAAPSPTADAANVTSARDAQPATEAHRP